MLKKIMRAGEDGHLRGFKDDNGRWRSSHKVPIVYLEMFMQIQRDFASLPTPVLGMTLSQIRSYYRFLRAGLKELTKPRGNPKT